MEEPIYKLFSQPSTRPINEALEDELEIQLRRALETAISEPAAEDVVLTDHLNRFIPPGPKASIEVVGFPKTHQDITPTIINNSIMIRLPNGLSADNTTRINIDAYIKLKNLATSASKMPLPEDEYSNSTQSNLSYCWLRERYLFKVPLPNSSIDISGPILSASQETNQNGRSTGSSIWLFLLRILGI